MMKRNYLIPGLLLFFLSFSALSQSRMTVYDHGKVLSPEVDSLVEAQLAGEGIEYVKVIDFSKKCDYYFAEIFQEGNNHFVKIYNCKGTLLGNKDLGSGLAKLPADRVAFLISYSIRDVWEQKIKDAPELAGQKAPEEEFQNEHDSRYFFSPSAFNLKKGELYYNTIYFLIHDIQYGFSDNFSMGMGTSVAGIPFYLTPKLSFKLGEKDRLAVGDLFITGTWGLDLNSNLAYATYTRGIKERNATFGFGYFYSTKNDLFEAGFSAPIFTFSSMINLTNYIYLITENYFMATKSEFEAEYYNYEDNIYKEEKFELNDNIILGFTGFRVINKNKDVVSWQFGLSYVFRMLEDRPSKYNGDYWDAGGDAEPRFVIPTVTFTQKFGKKF